MDDEISPASIQNVYKSYKCNCKENNDQLKWTCSDFIFNTKILCRSCNKNYKLDNKSVIRWVCNSCNSYYCSNCYKVVIKSNCPENHTLTKRAQHCWKTVCDICGRLINGYEYDYNDSLCNMVFCKDCAPLELTEKYN